MSVSDRSTRVLGADQALRLELDPRGACLRSLRVAMGSRTVEVCLAYSAAARPNLDPYYVGTLLGRYAGRIAQGRLQRGERAWWLDKVSGTPHSLHGGPDGFSARVWQIKEYIPEARLRLALHSPAGDQGFPGALDAEVLFELLADARTADEGVTASAFKGPGFAYEVRATCDAPTVVNLSHHAYFNLDGEAAIDGEAALNGEPAESSVLDHELRLFAERYTPSDTEGIPFGSVESVAGTAFDFREWRRIRTTLGQRELLPQGLDQNVIIDGAPGRLRPAAMLRSSKSGLQMSVLTTQPGMQVYSGGYLGAPFVPFAGICFETQNFPDAPNQQGFPDPWLLPGAVYRHRTEFRFSQWRADGMSGTVS